MHIKALIDHYFDLDGDIEGQLYFYGCIGTMTFVMSIGTIINLFI